MKTKAILTAILATAILATGCSSRGEGVTIDGDGLHIGTSLAQRDKIAEDKADAELDQLRARTVIEQDAAAASIEQSAAMGKITRPVVLAIGLAAAVGVAAVGLGYGAQRAAPSLSVALEVRKARSFQVGLTVSRDGCEATLTASGYSAGELAEVINGAPLLNAPRLAELQSRIGNRGVKLLQERGEIEQTLALLPDEINEKGEL